MSVRSLLIPVMIAAALLTGCGGARSQPAAGSVATSTAPSSLPSTAAPSQPGESAAPSSDPSGCPTSNTTAFAKTKFVLHTGLAFGAFHRYLYKPYQAGSFTSGTTTHKVLQATKAGVSALYIKREVRLAIIDVQANPALCSTLITPLRSVSDTLDGAVSKLKNGDTSGITSTESLITAVEGGAAKNGAPITEDPNAPAA